MSCLALLVANQIYTIMLQCFKIFFFCGCTVIFTMFYLKVILCYNWIRFSNWFSRRTKKNLLWTLRKTDTGAFPGNFLFYQITLWTYICYWFISEISKALTWSLCSYKGWSITMLWVLFCFDILHFKRNSLFSNLLLVRRSEYVSWLLQLATLPANVSC